MSDDDIAGNNFACPNAISKVHRPILFNPVPFGEEGVMSLLSSSRRKVASEKSQIIERVVESIPHVSFPRWGGITQIAFDKLDR